MKKNEKEFLDYISSKSEFEPDFSKAKKYMINDDNKQTITERRMIRFSFKLRTVCQALMLLVVLCLGLYFLGGENYEGIKLPINEHPVNENDVIKDINDKNNDKDNEDYSKENPIDEGEPPAIIDEYKDYLTYLSSNTDIEYLSSINSEASERIELAKAIITTGYYLYEVEYDDNPTYLVQYVTQDLTQDIDKTLFYEFNDKTMIPLSIGYHTLSKIYQLRKVNIKNELITNKVINCEKTEYILIEYEINNNSLNLITNNKTGEYVITTSIRLTTENIETLRYNDITKDSEMYKIQNDTLKYNCELTSEMQTNTYLTSVLNNDITEYKYSILKQDLQKVILPYRSYCDVAYRASTNGILLKYTSLDTEDVSLNDTWKSTNAIIMNREDVDVLKVLNSVSVDFASCESINVSMLNAINNNEAVLLINNKYKSDEIQIDGIEVVRVYNYLGNTNIVIKYDSTKDENNSQDIYQKQLTVTINKEDLLNENINVIFVSSSDYSKSDIQFN